MSNAVTSTGHEKLFTLKAAAKELNLRYWWIQRAVKRRELPYYTPFNSRKLVKLSEVQAYIDAARNGGLE